ncbi:ribonuclease H-like domain-containing protein [Tanacetum coccineum]
MCDKKNKVLFTDTECLVLSPDFKLPDEHCFNLENIVPTRGLACLIAKATVDESNKWHRRLGHVNFKNLNKLVKGNLKEEEKRTAEEQAAKNRYWKILICYDDDDDEESSIPLRDIIISGLPPCVVITPVLSTEEPVDSLIMEGKHLDTISATELDEVIKSSVEDLVPIPSESEGIPDKMCDVPFRDNSSPLDILKDQFEDFSDSNDDSTSIDDDSFSINDIKYVEALPPDSELVSLEEVEIVIPEVGGIDTDILLTIKDDILHEKLLNVNLLIANIEILRLMVVTLLCEEIEIFLDDSTIDVVEDIPIDVPNILPTHLALQLDFNFIPSLNDLGSDLDVSSPFGDSNKIYDPGICIEVESTRFLSTLSPVIDTLLSFSSENKDKVFNHGVLASKEKSSSSLSLRGFKASKLFHQKSPMIAPIFEASRARSFVLRSLEFHILSCILGIESPKSID